MKKVIGSLFASFICMSFAHCGNIGVVDFGKVMEKSKFGQQEQKDFESIRDQLQKGMEDLNKQLTETATKLEDQDVLDALSPEAEEELRQKFQALGEDMNRYQGQYYQVMQQANMKIMHVMTGHISKASEAVSKKQKCALILNREAVFHMDDTMDVSEAVITELDHTYDIEAKKAAVAKSAGK